VDSTTSRCFSVVGSIRSVSAVCVLHAHAAHVRELGLLRVAEVPHQGAGGRHRSLPALEAEAVEAGHAQLVHQRLPRGLQIEVPAVHLGDGNLEAGDLGNGPPGVVSARDDDLAWAKDGNLVLEGLQALGSRVLGDVEFARGEVQQRHAVLGRPARGHRCRGDGHQERRLARVEIAGIRQRSGRHHAHHLALHHALGLLRVLHLLADGHPVALLHEARDVAIRRVIGHAAHRHGGARRVLRSRGEGQVQRARRHQRVLVEHLVEIAHAEEDQGVAILPFRLEVLAHRGRQVRARGHGEGR